MTKYLLLLLISLCASLTLTPLVRWFALRIGAIDRPGKRKIHAAPIPRLGGVSVVLSVVVTVVMAQWFERNTVQAIQIDLESWLPVLIGGAVIFLIGVWDDIRPVPAWLKFVFQSSAALVAICLGVQIERVSLFGSDTFELGFLALPITFLWIVGITNAFNLVDGLDGLAAGLAIIAAGTSAVIFLTRGDAQDAMLLVIFFGALAGFLKYNFNPATIFLGDAGSLIVGYVLAITAISGSQKGATALAVVVPLLVFGLPILDTLLSMLRRFMGGVRRVQLHQAPLRERMFCAKEMFEPDQGHIHHRLLSLGFSHRNAVLALYILALMLSFLALISVLAHYRNAGIISIAVGLAAYIGIHKLGYRELSFLQTGTLLRWYEQLRFNRLFFLGFVDMVLIATAYWGAFVLKYEPGARIEIKPWYFLAFPLTLLVQLSVFYLAGLYKGVWRAMGIGDLVRALFATGAAVVSSFVLLAIPDLPPGGPAFFCIDLLLLGALVIGTRSTYRFLDYLKQRENVTGEAALIYGAGRGGQLVLQELLQNSELGLKPIGFLDDDLNLRDRAINRVSVLGTSYDLDALLDVQPITALIISSGKINGDRLHQVIGLCRKRRIAVLKGRIWFETVGLDETTLSEEPACQVPMGHETNFRS